MAPRKKVAVVGSGCSGIGAVWALNRSTDHEVHLYEAEERLGGHTNTVEYKHEGRTVNVDTGFIVMNTATYPNFLAFLKEIKVPTTLTEMTFGVSRDQGAFEWAGTSLSAVFAQRENVFSKRVWLMVFDIIRFNQFALDLLEYEDESEDDPTASYPSKASDTKVKKPHSQLSIGTYLEQEGYSEGFTNDYLIPMTAAVWSTHPDKASLDFPAITLVRFMWNHHLLTSIGERAPWMTIVGGTRQYIDAALINFPESNIHLKSPVESLSNTKDGQVTLKFASGKQETFDHVIIATHGDTSRSIIEDSASTEEMAIMSSFETSENTAVLHSDLSLMPNRHICWSSWNYMTKSPAASPPPLSNPTVCLTYNMNILQHISPSEFGDVLVTLNPLHCPDPATIQGSWTYHHPLYNAEAIRGQKLLPRIQNTRGISYCGAWTKYGFHEDGFSSGIKVAVDHLGAELPWTFVDSTFSRGRKPVLEWRDWAVRGFVRVVQAMTLIWGLVIGFLIPKGIGRERLSEFQVGMTKKLE